LKVSSRNMSEDLMNTFAETQTQLASSRSTAGLTSDDIDGMWKVYSGMESFNPSETSDSEHGPVEGENAQITGAKRESYSTATTFDRRKELLFELFSALVLTPAGIMSRTLPLKDSRDVFELKDDYWVESEPIDYKVAIEVYEKYKALRRE